jgi:nucleoside-diphosphate-sugar epimerase
MIVIIGGSGFIGTRLSLRLNQAKKIFKIIDKAPSTFFPKKVLFADISRPITVNFSMQPFFFIFFILFILKASIAYFY